MTQFIKVPFIAKAKNWIEVKLLPESSNNIWLGPNEISTTSWYQGPDLPYNGSQYYLVFKLDTNKLANLGEIFDAQGNLILTTPITPELTPTILLE